MKYELNKIINFLKIDRSKSAVVSQRSTGSCTRCTRANAFPGVKKICTAHAD